MATPGVPGVRGNNAGRRGVSYTSGEALRDFDRECPWQMEGGYMEDPVPCGLPKDPDAEYCPDHPG